MKSRDRLQDIYIGATRSGKTFRASKFCDAYAKSEGAVMVYNYGMETDFPDSEYQYIEPLSFIEHIEYVHSEKANSKEAIRRYRLNKKITHFWVGRGKNRYIEHFKKFNQLFVLPKKRVKILMMDKKEETAFFRTIHRYVSKTLLVIDDCKTVFPVVNAAHTKLLCSANHTGAFSNVVELRGYGVDIITIWHSADRVRTEFWDYATSIKMFKTINKPQLKMVTDETLNAAIFKCWKHLKFAEQYTCLEIKPRDFCKINKATI
jgi:hypothetical protein